MKIRNLPESPIEAVKMINVTVEAKKGVELYNIKNIDFESCKLSVASLEKITTHNAHSTQV